MAIRRDLRTFQQNYIHQILESNKSMMVLRSKFENSKKEIAHVGNISRHITTSSEEIFKVVGDVQQLLYQSNRDTVVFVCKTRDNNS